MSQSWSELTNAAESAARGGKYNEAKDAYRQALADAMARKDLLNAYHTLCNLAGLLRLLDEVQEAEQLLTQATKLRHKFPQHLARESISPITDMERIYVKQKRFGELEQLHLADTQTMQSQCGKDSFEYKMSLIKLAKFYGAQMKDMDKCRTHFREVLEWAKTTEPITCKMAYMEYDGVLRGAGLAAEADALQQELAAFRAQSKA